MQRYLILVVLVLLSPIQVRGAGDVKPDTTNADGMSGVVLPALFYTPETRIGGGGAAAFFRRLSDEAPTSSLLAATIVTQRRQVLLSLAPDLYLSGGRMRAGGFIQYQRFPDLFYGVGRSVGAEDEEQYTARSFELLAKVQRRVASGLRVGPRMYLRHRTFTDLEQGGMLASGRLPGSEAGTAVGMGVAAEWDSRDDLFVPTRGFYAESWASRFAGAIGGDYDFWNLTVDLRTYRSFGRGSVLAMQAWASASSGDVPFDLLPEMGGANVLRGYYQGQFRDDVAVVLQGEVRFPIWRSLGGVAFAAAGDVAPRLEAVDVARAKPSAGAGLRLRVNEEGVNIRLDYAVGQESSGLYVTLQEAF